MSQRQLGEKIGIIPQSVQELEQREKEGTITLNTLKQTNVGKQITGYNLSSIDIASIMV